jgi:hypothetical protein
MSAERFDVFFLSSNMIECIFLLGFFFELNRKIQMTHELLLVANLSQSFTLFT